jgi:hypothetical protein
VGAVLGYDQQRQIKLRKTWYIYPKIRLGIALEHFKIPEECMDQRSVSSWHDRVKFSTEC